MVVVSADRNRRSRFSCWCVTISFFASSSNDGCTRPVRCFSFFSHAHQSAAVAPRHCGVDSHGSSGDDLLLLLLTPLFHQHLVLSSMLPYRGEVALERVAALSRPL